MLLKDRLALVTGGGGGLGSAIAEGFAVQGARVIVADLDGGRASRVAESIIANGGQAWSACLDVTDRAACAAFAESMKATHGVIDILVNNAGMTARTKFDDPQMPETWDRVMAVNLHGVFNVTHAFVPALKETRGSIINLASVASYVSTSSTAAYVVSKGAIRSLTQTLAREMGPHGIRVNAVAPGVMETEMTADLRSRPEAIAWYMNRVPMARCGRADEVVGPIVFLASDMAAYVNGVVMPVDGGFLAT
ncbi:SDR family NAD(P)-dependent oxidoreductase [Noviherbaspirillum denitrificans]|uniref:SDR family NAD(P)-dependent oxidoreductase n=1 Tax=Noviherbaspirillum denitrificans TaxID=1968433 RepID=UPI001F204577|nr:SDR family NAD(P)-dependent oxidoreductase [Noviherbaspirillum denitrificans]